MAGFCRYNRPGCGQQFHLTAVHRHLAAALSTSVTEMASAAAGQDSGRTASQEQSSQEQREQQVPATSTTGAASAAFASVSVDSAAAGFPAISLASTAFSLLPKVITRWSQDPFHYVQFLGAARSIFSFAKYYNLHFVYPFTFNWMNSADWLDLIPKWINVCFDIINHIGMLLLRFELNSV